MKWILKILFFVLTTTQLNFERRKDHAVKRNSFDDKRSVIRLAELHYTNGVVTCNRDEPVMVSLNKFGYFNKRVGEKECNKRVILFLLSSSY